MCEKKSNLFYEVIAKRFENENFHQIGKKLIGNNHRHQLSQRVSQYFQLNQKKNLSK